MEVREEKVPLVKVKDIPHGECFKIEESIYMKIDDSCYQPLEPSILQEKCPVVVANIRNGALIRISDLAEVIPVKIIAQISDGEKGEWNG